jgi:DNA-binding CsgD family transcriptional regulator
MQAVGPGEVQELAWLHAARAEAAWLGGDDARARSEAEIGLELARMASPTVVPWFWSELAFWAWKTGGMVSLPDGTAEPYRLHAAGDHAAAAASWAAIGCPYQRAAALADSEDETLLREALRILRGLGARPLARRVEGALRRMGARNLPRGPRRATRANPGGLTERQFEVLALLAGGLHNSDIAERLVLSPKTVDHHVSSILAKLGVRTRKEAAHMAPLLQRKDGEFVPTT